MSTKRKLALKIFDLESAVKMVSAGENGMVTDSEFPNSAYLNLATGASTFPECEEEDEDLFDDDGFLQIPEDLEPDGYGTMAAFVESLDSGPVKEQLADAIIGRGAFRRFRDIVIERLR